MPHIVRRIMQDMTTRRRRWMAIVLAVVLASAASMFVPAIRTRVLRAAGRTLVITNRSVEPADIIVVAIDADGAGVLEAADLVHEGVSTRVAVFGDPPDRTDREFIRRSVPYEDRAARSIQQLNALGVEATEQIPTAVAGTEDEGRVLPDWCDQRGFRSVVIVSLSDHSRRLRRVLHRSMKGRGTKVTVRVARYSAFNPDQWWTTRDGIRSGIVELQKLILDLVRHPIS
jgi:hypothetical protein